MNSWNPATWMFDGNTPGDVTSTAPQMQATSFGLLMPQANSILLLLHRRWQVHNFMLNERTRELGEFTWKTWWELKHWLRTKLFDRDETCLPYHNWDQHRPWQIDLTVNGQLMSPAEKGLSESWILIFHTQAKQQCERRGGTRLFFSCWTIKKQI
jgi:hypothetical protein